MRVEGSQRPNKQIFQLNNINDYLTHHSMINLPSRSPINFNINYSVNQTILGVCRIS